MTGAAAHRSSCVLVGDIGGTNARFALYEGSGCGRGSGVLTARATLAASQYAAFDDAVQAFLAQSGIEPNALHAASFAVAAPVASDEIRFTNSPWQFSRRALAESLGLDRLTVINDFEALALRVPEMEAADLAVLREGDAATHAPKLVLGPGTGLGVAGVVPLVSSRGTDWQALAGEGGHVAFAPLDDFESELLGFMRRKHARVTVERLICGEGLVAVHAFLLARSGASLLRAATAADITREALNGENALAREAVMRFLAMLGSFAGDCALIYAARGGVYLGGGILPRLQPLLAASPLLERFDAKERMTPWVSRIPLSLVTDDAAALRGAAIAAERAQNESR